MGLFYVFFGLFLLIIAFSSMGPPYNIPRSSMVMSSVGFGNLFLILGFAIFLWSTSKSKKIKIS